VAHMVTETGAGIVGRRGLSDTEARAIALEHHATLHPEKRHAPSHKWRGERVNGQAALLCQDCPAWVVLRPDGMPDVIEANDREVGLLMLGAMGAIVEQARAHGVYVGGAHEVLEIARRHFLGDGGVAETADAAGSNPASSGSEGSTPSAPTTTDGDA
jgi:hypothetical protein